MHLYLYVFKTKWKTETYINSFFVYYREYLCACDGANPRHCTFHTANALCARSCFTLIMIFSIKLLNALNLINILLEQKYRTTIMAKQRCFITLSLPMRIMDEQPSLRYKSTKVYHGHTPQPLQAVTVICKTSVWDALPPGLTTSRRQQGMAMKGMSDITLWKVRGIQSWALATTRRRRQQEKRVELLIALIWTDKYSTVCLRIR